MRMEHIGDHQGVPILYGSIAGTDGRLDLSSVRGRPWIWVLDCHGMTARQCLDVSAIRAIGTQIEREHAATLRGVWILNPNSWIRAAVGLFGSAKVTMLPSDRLELFVHLQRAGITHATVDRFLAAVRAT